MFLFEFLSEGMDISEFDMLSGNIWIIDVMLLFYFVALGWLFLIFFITSLTNKKPLTSFIFPCIALSLPFGAYLATYFDFIIDVYDYLGLSVGLLVLIYAVSFSFIPSLWCLYAGFKKQIKWQAYFGLPSHLFLLLQ